MELVIEGRALYEGRLQELAIGVDGGLISKVGKVLRGERVLDFGDNIILPGAVDAHVHLREPGLTRKEDIATGTTAAACGGVTTVLEMPNTIPPAASISAIREKAGIASRRACVDIGLFAGFTVDNPPVEAASMVVGYKLYMSSATEALLISDYSSIPSLLAGISETGKPMAVHAEDEAIIRRLGLLPKNLREHSESRPPEAETEAARKFIEALGKGRGHICHLSAGGTLELIGRARSGQRGNGGEKKDGGAGVPGRIEMEAPGKTEAAEAEHAEGNGHREPASKLLTCELTPHHLLLDADDHASLGALAKTNPPVRGMAERAALWRAFLDGSVDILASDHAPHLEEEKDTSFADAPAGVPGTETMVPLMIALAKKGRVPLQLIVAMACSRPAEVYGINCGKIAPGMPASLAVYDPTSASEIKGKKLHSKCAWSPFEGFEAIFPRAVLLRGELIVEGGEPVVSPGQGRLVGSGRPEPSQPPFGAKPSIDRM
ncbi:MAG: amidohydrolase family protein [Thermoplasmata archaeon]